MSIPDLTVPFFRPDIPEDEIAEVVNSIRSGWLTTGPRTKDFENAICELTGAKYAIALNSCTAALHLALEAVGLQRGEMVLVPTMTFGATAEVVRYFDAIPVFVDCDDTLCMDPERLDHTISSILNGEPVAGLEPPYGKVRAVIPMHYGGYACQMDRISAIAKKYNADMIEDAAHTFPAHFRQSESSDWKHCGTFGKVGCFSFYANKCITTGEGGAAITDDEEIAERMRVMSLHGMNKDAWKRYTASGSWYYELVAPGFKYNMTDLAASLGVHQIKRVDEYREKRENIAHRFSAGFRGNLALTVPHEDATTRLHSWHLYHLRLNLDTLTIDRAEFIELLKARGVMCSVHWLPLHMHPYYKKTFNIPEGIFTEAEQQWSRLISLPLFPSMRDEEVDHVINAVLEIVRENRKG